MKNLREAIGGNAARRPQKADSLFDASQVGLNPLSRL
jgi:hypothetical protein